MRRSRWPRRALVGSADFVSRRPFLPLVALAALAHVAAPGPVAEAQGIPFHTPTALPLPLAENGIRAFYQHMELHDLLRGGRAVANPENLAVIMDVVPVMIQAAVTPHTIAIVGGQYRHASFDRNGTAKTNSGSGDVTVMVRQDLLANDFVAGNRRLAVLVGASLPTGDTGDNADPLAPPLRLGTGTVNVSGQAVYSYVNNRFGVHGALGYAAATGSRFGVRPGDRVLYNLAFGARIAPEEFRTRKDVSVAAYLELIGNVEQRSTQQGASLADTGGHLLLLAPGVQVIPLQNWALDASLQLPVVRDTHGTQLAPAWSLAIGLRTVFYLLGG